MGDSSENVGTLNSPVNSNQEFTHKDLELYENYSNSNGQNVKFSLAMSDTESLHTNRTNSQSSFGELVHEPEEDVTQTYPGDAKRPELQLSLILGISEDEKAENRLANAGQKKLTARKSTEFCEDNEFEYLRDKSLRKCISLKTNKTPPTTPGKKKAVRFADALGLDLASVRHVLDMDEPPVVPESAMRDLKLASEPPPTSDDFYQIRRLCVCFSPPESCPDFLRRVQERKVLLESCYVDDLRGSVYGKIRVMNMAFHKLVTVRYTLNGWLTHTNVSATYDSGSYDGATDKFCYSIAVPEYFQPGNSMEFSVMYTTANQTFWDNNYGSNYRIECYIGNEPSKFY